MKGIIDRFEDDIVVVEIDGETKDYPKSMFPKEVQVGDMILIKEDRITVLNNETEARRKEIEDLMDDVWED